MKVRASWLASWSTALWRWSTPTLPWSWWSPGTPSTQSAWTLFNRLKENYTMVRMWFFDLDHQVTARGGRPVLICEEGDLETQRLNPDNCLTIPHTVDCLQVGGILTLVLTNSSTSTLTELMILLPPRGFSVSFHFSCSPITWRSSSESTAVITSF